MKRFLEIAGIVLVLCILLEYGYYYTNIYIDFHPDAPVETTFTTRGKTILRYNAKGQSEPFEIRGVDLSSAIPGHFAIDYAIDKETYLRWFAMIQDMGANTIRIYTILSDDFYDAFYEYNKGRKEPLYLIHGVWVNDYVLFSKNDAYDDKFYGDFLSDSKKVVDIIHGKRKIMINHSYGSGSYNIDISPWVLGYILGVEWEPTTVSFTDHNAPEKAGYKGRYMYTAKDATPFETMLARVGDAVLSYESRRYKSQRLMAFANWPTTDPLEYSEAAESLLDKYAAVDVEHILLTDKVGSGQFASYHIYPYSLDLIRLENEMTIPQEGDEKVNLYDAYVNRIVAHHSMPTVVSEFGMPTSRGVAHIGKNTDRNQGFMTEQQQGETLVESYKDIMNAGGAGAIIYGWQDEWFKRTWNTMYGINQQEMPFWTDVETCGQFYGLLSFDPGKEKSVCYVDGDISEWKDDTTSQPGKNLFMKYDEKYIYFLIHKKGYTDDMRLYIPIDLTPKSGSNYYGNAGIKLKRESDFVVDIHGRDDSHVYVQEYYELLRATRGRTVYKRSPFVGIPDKNTDVFVPIELLLEKNNKEDVASETFETGKLTYGNGNPDAPDFNSLADFCINGDYIELRLPWSMLNFSNPSKMRIHDDYYEHYGVEELEIKGLYAGVGTDANRESRVGMQFFALEGWGDTVTYHERLKKSYYIMKDLWNPNGDNR